MQVSTILFFNSLLSLLLIPLPKLISVLGSLQEGITAVENRTAGIIQETRKIQIRKKSDSSRSQNQASNFDSLRQPPQTHVQPQIHATLETQLKASRDVRLQLCCIGVKTQLFC